MNFILIASFLILGQVIYSAELGYPQFEIKEGNCSKTIARDLVHEKRIRLPKMPFLIREANDSWAGNFRIYCLIARSLKSEEKGSSVDIAKGGLGMTFVTFKMKSSMGHGLYYKIKVFANTTL